MFEKLKARYLKNYIRDDQLDRYVQLKVITADEAELIRAAKEEVTPPPLKETWGSEDGNFKS